MKLRILIIASIVLIGLSACGERPVEGTVTHKSYSPAYVYYTHPCDTYRSRTTTSYSGTGTSRRAYTTTTQECVSWGTHMNYMPASYQLCVDGTDKNGKHASDCMYVREGEFARYREGDHWSR